MTKLQMIKSIPKKYLGHNANRLYGDNPLELLAAKLWSEERDVLSYLMGDGVTKAAVSKRDELVAATVIQWLGSTIGQCFPRDLHENGNQ